LREKSAHITVGPRRSASPAKWEKRFLCTPGLGRNDFA